ncbi:Uma2 family endonuclease [Chloroflexi bacterium TSY]|nr:Uma2 family endonuclease [Chloroflexi bacterium TSY]
MYVWFLYLLKDYLSVHPIAEMVGQEIGFSLNLASGTRVRAPDLGIVLNSNPVPIGDRDRSYNGIFDLCIEFVSNSKTSEIERDTVHKYNEYAQRGVTEYFILDGSPASRTNETAFYRLDPAGIYQPISPVNGVIQSSVLPGFQFRVADLYTSPNPTQLLSDVIYQSYVSPELWMERQRVERAEAALQQSKFTLEETQSTLEETRSTLEEEQERANRVRAYLDSQGTECVNKSETQNDKKIERIRNSV